jgi:hypothetical protein
VTQPNPRVACSCGINFDTETDSFLSLNQDLVAKNQQESHGSDCFASEIKLPREIVNVSLQFHLHFG